MLSKFTFIYTRNNKSHVSFCRTIFFPRISLILILGMDLFKDEYYYYYYYHKGIFTNIYLLDIRYRCYNDGDDDDDCDSPFTQRQSVNYGSVIFDIRVQICV